MMAQKYYAYLAGMKFETHYTDACRRRIRGFRANHSRVDSGGWLKSCDDNPSGNPKDALRLLDKVEAFVPFVPPEEAAYLEKEETAASEIGLTARFVQNRTLRTLEAMSGDDT